MKYSVGTRVFCDFFFGGKPEGIVKEIIRPGDGKCRAPGLVSVKLSKSAGPYKRGEIVKVPTWQAVPKKQEFRKPGSCFRYVNTDFEWVS